jgi:hypothetical protein
MTAGSKARPRLNGSEESEKTALSSATIFVAETKL